MRLKTFTAPDMNRAMLMIRETMGDDAVIISTTRDSSGKNVSVTAAYDEPEEMQPWEEDNFHDDVPVEETLARQVMPEPVAPPPAKPRPTASASPRPNFLAHEALMQNRDLAFFLNELEKLLMYHSVPLRLTEKLMRAAMGLELKSVRSQEDVQHALAELLAQIFKFAPIDLHHTPEKLIFVGPHGVGKTAVVAKMAADLVTEKRPVQVVSIDNKRAGGIEQLQAFTTVMGLELEVADSRNELRSLLKSLPANEPVLVDCFGVNPYQFEELKELNLYAGIHGLEPVLVMAAGSNSDEAAESAQALRFLAAKRLVLTRCDAAKRLGAAMAAADAAGLAFSAITNSASVAGGLKPLDPETLAQYLINSLQEYDHAGE